MLSKMLPNTVDLFLCSFKKRAWMAQVWPVQGSKARPCTLSNPALQAGSFHHSWAHLLARAQGEISELNWCETEKEYNVIRGRVQEEGYLYFFIFEEFYYLLFMLKDDNDIG